MILIVKVIFKRMKRTPAANMVLANMAGDVLGRNSCAKFSICASYEHLC